MSTDSTGDSICDICGVTISTTVTDSAHFIYLNIETDQVDRKHFCVDRTEASEDDEDGKEIVGCLTKVLKEINPMLSSHSRADQLTSKSSTKG